MTDHVDVESDDDSDEDADDASDNAVRSFKASLDIGGLLILLGAGAYVATDFASVTALIPSIFGLIIAVLGYVGWQYPERSDSAMYSIGLFAVLGIAGSLRGIPDIIALLTGGNPESTVAAVSQLSFIILSLVLVAIAAKYVIDNR